MGPSCPTLREQVTPTSSGNGDRAAGVLLQRRACVLFNEPGEPMRRNTSTILPPPSDFPVPMPDTIPPSESESGTWRVLVAEIVETVRPPRRSPDDDGSH